MGWYNYYNNKLLYLKPDEAFALFLEDVKICYPGPKYIQRPSVPIPPISLISINPVAPTSPSLSSISSPLHISISPAAAPLLYFHNNLVFLLHRQLKLFHLLLQTLKLNPFLKFCQIN